MSSNIQKIKEKFLGLFGIRDSLYLIRFVSVMDWVILAIGCFLAGCTGAGLPHLVGNVGWILNIYIFMDPKSDEYSAEITPLLLYYVAMAIMLSIIAFFQYACFRYVALNVSRRLRRKYFQSLLHQNLEFFQLLKSQEINKTIFSDIQKVSVAISETLPAIFTAIVQLVTAGLISFLLTWRLSWLISALSIGCGIWVFILQKLIQLETEREAKINVKIANFSNSEENEFQKLLKQQLFCGTRKGFLQGTLVGSLQLFPFLGWGTGAIYGNWLIDENLMHLPANIYVCASTLIPACVRMAQLPFLLIPLKTLPKIGRSMKHVSIKAKNRTSQLKNVDEDLDESKKEFLISFFKSEIGTLPQELNNYKSPTFCQARRNALSHWFLYSIALICCGMVGAASAALTKMNGNMFEFYNKPNIRTYFSKGAKIAMEYLIVGVTTFICGIVAGSLFGYNSESAIKKLRELLFKSLESQSIKESTLMNLISKHTGPIRGAFDNRLSAFIIGILAIICAILSNVHKSLSFTFLTAVSFTLQLVAQFFVIKFAEIYTQDANEISTQKGIETIHNLENTLDNETTTPKVSIKEIEKIHNSYLTFSFRKHNSTIFFQSLRFSFLIAVPQITQAISYAMGSYLIVNKLLTPVTVYKIVQTVYNALSGVAAIAQYPNEIYASKLAAQKIDENIDLININISNNKPSSHSSSISTTSIDNKI